jgi:hypothetical protein
LPSAIRSGSPDCTFPSAHSDKLNGLARHQFAVIALAAVALASSFWLLLDLVSAYTRNTETFGVASFEDRFSEFRKSMPSHFVLGYLSDNPLNDPSNQSEFNLTQYTLAPAIVKPSVNERLVVVNYHSGKVDQAALQARHLVPIRNFGNGVLLCRNDAP